MRLLTDQQVVGIVPGQAERVRGLITVQQRLIDDGQTPWAVIPASDQTDWQLVGASESEIRIGLEVFRAFVGRHIATVLPSKSSRKPEGYVSHPISVVAELDVFLEVIELLVDTRKSQPAVRHRNDSSIAELLGDFYSLVEQSESRNRLEASFNRIQQTGQLSLPNLRYLTVEWMAATHSWVELRNQKWFDEVAGSHKARPARINSRLLETIWRTTFDDLEALHNPDFAVDQFNAHLIHEKFGSLLAANDSTNSSAGRRLLVLSARAEGDFGRASRIIELAPGDEQDALTRLSGIDADVEIETTTPISTVEEVESLIDQGKFESAIKIGLEDFDGNARIARLLVEAASYLEDMALAKSVVEAIDGANLDELKERRTFQDRYQKVLGIANAYVSGWVSWAERLAVGSWGEGFDAVANFRAEWPISDFKHSTTCKRFAELLVEAHEGINAALVRQSYAFLCELSKQLFEEKGESTNDVLLAVLLILSADDNPSETTRNAFLDLVDGALSHGPATETYRDLVAQTSSMWAKVKSPYTVEWAVDACEVLGQYPCPTDARSDRQQVVADVHAALTGYASKLPPELIDGFNEIAKIVELPELLLDIQKSDHQSEVQVSDVWQALEGKTIGIYSLLNGAAALLERRLRALGASGYKVIGDSSHDSTDSLRNMVERSDYLIVDTRHAKHAATMAIDVRMERSRQILPDGRGISSFVRALGNRLSDESAQ